MEMSTVDIRYCMTAWRRWWGGAADLLTLYALRRQKYGTRKLSLEYLVANTAAADRLCRLWFMVYGTARLEFIPATRLTGCTMCCDG